MTTPVLNLPQARKQDAGSQPALQVQQEPRLRGLLLRMSELRARAATAQSALRMTLNLVLSKLGAEAVLVYVRPVGREDNAGQTTVALRDHLACVEGRSVGRLSLTCAAKRVQVPVISDGMHCAEVEIYLNAEAQLSAMMQMVCECAGQQLAGVALLQALEEVVEDRRAEVRLLHEDVTRDKLLHRAAGIVARRRRMDITAAFDFLAGESRSRRMKIEELAKTIIDAEPHVPPVKRPGLPVPLHVTKERRGQRV